MNAQPQTPTNDLLQQILAPLAEQRDNMLEEERVLTEELADMRRERQRIERVLRAADDAPARQSHPKSKATPSRVSVSAEKRRAVRDAIADLRGKGLDPAPKDVLKYLTDRGYAISEPTVHNAIRHLRDNEEIRMYITDGSKRYALMDAD